MLGMVRAILPADQALWSVSVNVKVNVVPLSSSPEPVNVKPELIPIGLPVTSPELDDHVAVAPPLTVISPALAAETAARDPHKLDKPIFVSLLIIVSP